MLRLTSQDDEAGETHRDSGVKAAVVTESLLIRRRPPRPSAMTLLHSQGLPALDITDEHLEHFFFTGSDGFPTGLVGIELYGTDALLRSLIGAESTRTRGIGSALVQHTEDYAASHQRTSLNGAAIAVLIGASLSHASNPPLSLPNFARRARRS